MSSRIGSLARPVLARAVSVLGIFVLLIGPRASHAQDPLIRPGWTDPIPPVQMAEGLYFVGSAALSSFLITSDEGHILIDVPLPENVGLVLENVQELGFDPGDIRILLGSQAHFDHEGGFAPMMEITGADLYLSELDGALVAAGGSGDFHLGDSALFPPASSSRTVGHLDQVSIGERTLTAHLTPGHTKGCTTWSGEFEVDGETVLFVTICSLTALPGYRLVGDDPSYPGIAQDFCESLVHLGSLDADIFASTHTDWFDLPRKAAAVAAGQTDAFVDPQDYAAFLSDSQTAIEQTLADQGQPGGCAAVLGRGAGD